MLLALVAAHNSSKTGWICFAGWPFSVCWRNSLRDQ